MNIAQLYDKLTSIPLFRGISGEDLATITERVHLRWINLEPEQFFIREGEQCNHIAVLYEGQMWITSRGKDYEVTETIDAQHIIEPEQLHGLECRYRRTYKAKTTCKVLLISKKDIRQTLMHVPVWRINFLNHISLKYTKQMDRETPTPMSMKDRIMRFGTSGESQHPQHTLHIRMEDLGNYLGETRRTISRHLHELASEGKLTMRPNEIEFK